MLLNYNSEGAAGTQYLAGFSITLRGDRKILLNLCLGG